MSDLISIIIPVYNTQDYLSECIESVLKQTYKNLEIILVDDGSNDNSAQICDDYARKFERIKVIHQKNVGALKARKAGLKQAVGKYIGFIDSDDWIEANMYEMLHLRAVETNAKVVTSLICKEYSNKSIIIKDAVEPGVYRANDRDNNLYHRLLNCGNFTDGGIHASLCTKLIENNLVRIYMDAVDERIVNGDDAAVLYPALAFADTVCVTDFVMYHYRMRDDSITHSIDERHFERTNHLYLHLKSLFSKHQNSDLLMEQLDKFLLNEIMTGLHRRYNIKNKPFFQFPYQDINKSSSVILYGAGNVGQDYYEQIKDNSYCKLIRWVDLDYKKYSQTGLPVKSIENINELEADYILIAVNNPSVGESIKEQLLCMGISSHKIIWKQPKILFNSLVIK